MKLGSAIVGIVAWLIFSATPAFSNPQMEEQNKPGYPMPGTKATDEFGKKAEQKATTEVNKEFMGDCEKASQTAKGEVDKEGYPMPGTKATDEFGKKAEQKATTEVNKEMMGGSGQGSRGVPCSK